MNIYLWDLFKAWRRDERRTAPRGFRGRVYERKAKAKVLGTISAKVFRANGDVEDLGVISELRKEE